AVGIAPEGAEILGGPTLVANGRPLTVRQRLDLAASLGDGPGRPGGNAGVARSIAGDRRAGEDEVRQGHPSPRRGQDDADGRSEWRPGNLVAAVPSVGAAVVVADANFRQPGSGGRAVNGKKGFSLTLCVVSKVTTVLPRYVTTTLLM